MMPLYQTGGFDYPVAMTLATLLGIGFGFVLERAGFGRADVLVGQFRGTDMRVLKVMFTAIATTAVGIALLSGVGAMDLSKLVIPETFMWPQIVGGLLLGVGFVVSGYCPGTAIVSAASGHIDALYSLGGVAIGSLVFGFVYPALEAFYEAGSMGAVTFPDLFGIPWPVVALLVAMMAIGSFLLAERLEKVFARRNAIAPPTDSPRVRNGTLTGLFGVAALALLTLAMPSPEIAQQTAAAQKRPATLNSVELAMALADLPDSLYLVDIRAPDECAKGTLPHATCLPKEDPEATFLATLPPTRTLVLFAEGELGYVPTSALAYAGSLRTLAGGRGDFHKNILTAPTPPAHADTAALSDYRLRAALHARFTGTQQKLEAPAPTVKPVTRAVKKGGGC